MIEMVEIRPGEWVEPGEWIARKKPSIIDEISIHFGILNTIACAIVILWALFG